jgi:hypothetical protein
MPWVCAESIVFLIGLKIIRRSRSRLSSSSQKIKYKKRYCYFIAKELNNNEEFRIFKELTQLVKKYCKMYNKNINNVKFYHYGNIE